MYISDMDLFTQMVVIACGLSAVVTVLLTPAAAGILYFSLLLAAPLLGPFLLLQVLFGGFLLVLALLSFLVFVGLGELFRLTFWIEEKYLYDRRVEPFRSPVIASFSLAWTSDISSYVEDKIGEREKEARRKRQVRITGFAEKDSETPVTLKQEVEDFFERKMKVQGVGTMIVDVFRIGKKGEDKLGRPRVVIVRLGSEWQRNQVLKGKPELKNWMEIGVDFDRSPKEMQELREELRKKWVKKKKQEGKNEIGKAGSERSLEEIGQSLAQGLQFLRKMAEELKEKESKEDIQGGD